MLNRIFYLRYCNKYFSNCIHSMRTTSALRKHAAFVSAIQSVSVDVKSIFKIFSFLQVILVIALQNQADNLPFQ